MSNPQPVVLNASHYHQCAICEVTLICCCNDKRQVDRLTGKLRRLLCVQCGDIQAAMWDLDATG